ncbi:MAG: hypothetical protein LBS21_05705 [Clostridiales bacterium]|jgi:hypothetical protein|nr:hypothetical protein [Clostridiales bacterium]
MNGNSAIDFRNPAVIRKAGLTALKNELGTVGTAYFLRQFGTGSGDYTAQRDRLLDGITLDEIINNVRLIDENTNNS